MTEIIQKMDDKLEGLEEIKALLSPCKTERSADGQEHWSIEAEIKVRFLISSRISSLKPGRDCLTQSHVLERLNPGGNAKRRLCR